MKSHFFAYMSKMKYIKRWAIMRNVQDENIGEHSLQTAMIAHALALIKNKYYGGSLEITSVLVTALTFLVSDISSKLVSLFPRLYPVLMHKNKKHRSDAVKTIFLIIFEKAKKPLLVYCLILTGQYYDDGVIFC